MTLTDSEKELLQTVHDIQYAMGLNKEVNDESSDFQMGYITGIEAVTKWLQGLILGVYEIK